jgi:hypothetical protein
MRDRDDDREDFLADYGDGSEPECEPDERRMAEGGPEFEPEDYCERHACWKPYCKGKSHDEDEEAGDADDWKEEVERRCDDISVKLNRAVFKTVFPKRTK